MVTIVAGVDISKDTLDVHAADQRRRFANDSTSWRALTSWLRGLEVSRVVIEATGRYHRKVHQCLHDRGFEVVLVNPLRARRFAESAGHLAKTDRVDALMLAKMGMALADLEPVAPREAFLNRLEDLLVVRAKHVDARLMLKQVTCEVDGEGAAVSGVTVAVLDERIAALEAMIEKVIADDADQAERFRILTSIPGVGAITAAALVCWMPELGSLGGRQAAALIGVAPFANDSGQHRGARHVRGGRRRPRDVLFMAATSAARHNADLRVVFERLKAAGKAHKCAIVALMRKLIVLANTLLRERRCWSVEAPAQSGPSRRGAPRPAC